MREWMVVEEKKKIVEEKRSWSKKSEWDKKQKTLLKGMGLQASRPGTRIEGSRIPKILEKQLLLQSWRNMVRIIFANDSKLNLKCYCLRKSIHNNHNMLWTVIVLRFQSTLWFQTFECLGNTSNFGFVGSYKMRKAKSEANSPLRYLEEKM